MSAATAARGFPGDDDYEEGTDYPAGADTTDYGEADELLGATIPSASFPEKGTTVEGIITHVGTASVRNPEGEVQRWDDGRIKRQVVLTLDTDERDNTDDDGRRRLFVKGGMVRPFREAIGKAKVSGPRVGGHVVVTYYDDGERTSRAKTPPKLYSIGYTPPVG